jgi:cytochrome c biogenesis factor
VEGARVGVSRNGVRVSTLEPRANFYPGVTGGIITPAVMTRPGGDLYLTLRSLEDETIELGLDTSPMIWLVWLGGLTTATGGFWSLSTRRRQREVQPEPVLADV